MRARSRWTAVRAGYEPARNQANALRTGLSSISAFTCLVAALASDHRPGRFRQETTVASVTGAP